MAGILKKFCQKILRSSKKDIPRGSAKKTLAEKEQESTGTKNKKLASEASSPGWIARLKPPLYPLRVSEQQYWFSPATESKN
jgi:hypothetical protein